MCFFNYILCLVFLFFEGWGGVTDLTTYAYQFPGGNPALDMLLLVIKDSEQERKMLASDITKTNYYFCVILLFMFELQLQT